MNDGGHPVGMIVGNLIAWSLYGMSHLSDDIQTWAAAASLVVSLILLVETAYKWWHKYVGKSKP